MAASGPQLLATQRQGTGRRPRRWRRSTTPLCAAPVAMPLVAWLLQEDARSASVTKGPQKAVEAADDLYEHL